MSVKRKIPMKAKSTKHSNKLNKGKRAKKSKRAEKKSKTINDNKELDQAGSDVDSHLSDGMTSDSSDVEEDYEKAPRLTKAIQVRNLLPVKSKKGLVFRSQIIPEQQEEVEDPVNISQTPNKPENKNLVQNYAVEQESLNDLKKKVAILCTSLIEEPENNMAALKELIAMLQNPSTKMIVSEIKILCVSLLHVFSDILPGYKIRLQEEKDSKVKLKKETKKLLGYEQTLLKCYKKYLDLLYDLIRDMKHKIGVSTLSNTKKKVSYEIGITAVKCMCELIPSKFSFNYFKNIVNKLVPLAIDVDEKVTKLCCESFQKLFRADKLGEASFNLVSQIVVVIKERKFVVPIDLLNTFLRLNLREARVEKEKFDMNKGRKEWQMMSRTERKNKKKIKDLEVELREAQAYESVDNVKKFHTATLNKVFWVFFHILKDGKKVALIPSALEGLSKFAYLINLEFFDDLNAVLCGMMENGQLTDVEKLHGVHTLFTILAGQAESLHIDPHKIYCHMYDGLLNLGYSTDVEHFDLTLQCLEFNIVRKRKKISFNRILAFTKRVSSICLQTPIHGTLGLLSTVRNVLMNVKTSDILLDSESTLGSGIYFAEMEDPEHCNPQSTALWELHLLRKHYNPALQVYASHLLNGCPSHGRLNLPEKLSKLTPQEILHLFAEVAVENKMDFLEDAEEPPKKKFKSSSHSVDFYYENEIDLNLDEESLNNFNIFVGI